jgi:hypothetical protein
MQTRARDLFWLLVSLVAASAAATGAALSVRRFAQEPDLGDVFGLLLLAVVAFWIVRGAWLRTKWGAPAGGSRDTAERELSPQTR